MLGYFCTPALSLKLSVERVFTILLLHTFNRSL
ncbi:MAG: hypothetical protein JWN50_658 [Parcubacteria group bacterium]|nr:hypothetical protein [Parcubacteria group bacterium]